MTDVNELVQHHDTPDRVPVTDDVDSRAAALMARLAARASGPDPAPELALSASVPGPYDEDIASPSPELPLEDTPAVEDPAWPSEDRSPTGRRMAAPPWQSPVDPVHEPFPPRPDHGVALEIATHSPATEFDDNRQPELHSDQATGPRPPLPPPPGWIPLPPPPGWPGQTLLPPPARQIPPARSAVHRGVPPAVAEPRLPVTLPGGHLRDITTSPDADEVAPQFGWRRAVYRATRGRVNPGVSAVDRELQTLLNTVRQPLAGDFRVAVLSIKGGVGKTTTTIGLGSAFAMARSDRVIAVDANPDRGTLAERISDSSTTSTVHDLLLDPNVARYADVRRHTRLAPSRLEVLASVQDPAVAEVFGESDYRRAIEILQPHYNIILTDCGTGIMHSSMASVLELAHSLVLVSSPAADAARSAAATLDWLTQHGHGTLARESHMVFSGVRAGSVSPVFDEVYRYFEARTGSVHVVPFESHLARGADVDFSMLSPNAVRAYLDLAGAVAGGFARVR